MSFCSVSKETMPTKKRGELSYKPTGWEQNKYPNLIEDDGFLYNRCHLTGFQLTGENDNPTNLFTCTKYANVQGMEPFESKIAKFIKQTDYHVLYRVTPMYYQDDMLARGVLLEAKSVEDKGKGLEFCVFVYNVQPEIDINYKTGENNESVQQ